MKTVYERLMLFQNMVQCLKDQQNITAKFEILRFSYIYEIYESITNLDAKTASVLVFQ